MIPTATVRRRRLPQADPHSPLSNSPWWVVALVYLGYPLWLMASWWHEVRR